jgi:acyl carrier protein
VNSDGFQEWLVSHLAAALGKPASEIDVNATFDRFGLDSAAYVSMSADVEDRLGIRLDVTDLYDHSTVRRLAKHLESSGALEGK